MIGFKGRLAFRQYTRAKPTKYRIKVWMADAKNGFVSNCAAAIGLPLQQVIQQYWTGEEVVEIKMPIFTKKMVQPFSLPLCSLSRDRSVVSLLGPSRHHCSLEQEGLAAMRKGEIKARRLCSRSTTNLG